LDIYLPELNLAIEYHGLYWHSYNKKETPEEKFRHYEKYKICKDKNIKLIQIFEHEWNDHKPIIKSILLINLNKNHKKIYARKTTIESIPFNIAKKFIEKNHIQPSVAKSDVNLCLKHEGEIVAVMTFAKPRFNKNHQWELIRYCSRLNTVVIGGASKLFKHFEKEYRPHSIISYSDIRFFGGKIYNILGFDYSHKSPPNYFYYKDDRSKSILMRYQCQKHKLHKFLPDFDPSLTEYQNMFNHGYRRVWDSGNMVFTKHYT
jgi:hypothetical protein